MIPPVAGNGMSMAFEAAEFAVSPLAAYSRGDLSWNGARKLFARTCDAAFATRLRWANALQWFMFARVLPEGLAALALRSEFLWQLMFAKTR
jgi:2-polyprenyl-6-methoxyphenol hydroxylase-like FAD-dependent oxidoreductase